MEIEKQAGVKDVSGITERDFTNGDSAVQNDDSVPTEDELLESAGIAPEQMATVKAETEPSESDMEIVKNAIRELNQPKGSDIVHFATDHGVGEDKAQRLIQQLYDAGRIIKVGAGYEFV